MTLPGTTTGSFSMNRPDLLHILFRVPRLFRILAAPEFFNAA